MLRLLLMRHSKTEPFTGAGDHQRALTKRGRDDAARLGAFIAQNAPPHAAVHSGARRSAETLTIVLSKLRAPMIASIEPRLYEASEAIFLQALRERPDSDAVLLVVGHNPNLGVMARRLAAHGDRRGMSRIAEKFPTSGLAIIDFEKDHWAEIDEGAGRLVRFVTPADLHDDE